MTDAQNPENAPPPYGAAPPPAPTGAPVSPTIPGRTLGIVALILAFFVQLVALILGIIALVQSKKAGYKNTPAVWAIIVSSVLMVVGIIIAIALITGAIAAGAELCAQYGTGTHEINGVTVTLNCG
ncbi:MAG TPA: DUF4190 domain-containing protein [Microbacterium sp.]|uniref:DUF4190 domain-containing protein n=1 Tax=Microbacterium sp. TaxID=51671 RepID=UPI002B63D846|nr:DUF4190 domain-containing protein [Microbacterium sp.]HWI32202.1 DUF4190 domain-containing protein [Microbacterium sp.]